MTLAYLLDTNVVSEPMRARPNERIIRRLKREQERIAISAVVWHELLFGCWRLPASTKRSTIETYLREVVARTIPILPYDEYAAEWHAVERARLTARGKMPAFVDGQIAAVAKTKNLILVTFNVADYENFAGISVQNWQS